MIKIRKDFWSNQDAPFIHFRQARIDMILANGDKLGTVQTLPFQDDAPSKDQWLAKVSDVWDVADISFRDFGVQSCKAPKGHPAWNLLNS